jgi:predicted HTH transcriptional regulator
MIISEFRKMAILKFCKEPKTRIEIIEKFQLSKRTFGYLINELKKAKKLKARRQVEKGDGRKYIYWSVA